MRTKATNRDEAVCPICRRPVEVWERDQADRSTLAPAMQEWYIHRSPIDRQFCSGGTTLNF